MCKIINLFKFSIVIKQNIIKYMILFIYFLIRKYLNLKQKVKYNNNLNTEGVNGIH
jgi:hypothetical protein